MGNVLKKPDLLVEVKTCALCGAVKREGEMSHIAARTGELICRACLRLCATTHAEDEGRRDRRVALAAKEITDVIQKHCLSEAELWIALGTAGSYCVMEKGIRR